jgi:ketosteroid isomerase-like protein
MIPVVEWWRARARAAARVGASGALAALVALAALAALAVAAEQPAATAGGYGVPDARTRAELVAAREAIWRAWFAFDSAALERLLPERALALEPGGGEWPGRAEIIRSSAAFARGGGRLVSLAFPRTEFHVFGDVAVLYSRFTLETESGGRRSTQRGQATELFVRRGGVWQNPSWHLAYDAAR